MNAYIIEKTFRRRGQLGFITTGGTSFLVTDEGNFLRECDNKLFVTVKKDEPNAGLRCPTIFQNPEEKEEYRSPTSA